MGDVYLTESNCAKAEMANEQLPTISEQISRSVSELERCINDATISQFITDTEKGQKMKNRIEKYNASLQSLQTALGNIHAATVELIAKSRKNNAA